MAGAALPFRLCNVVKGIRAPQGQAVVILGLIIFILMRIPGDARLIEAFPTERGRVSVRVTIMVPAILWISLLGKVE
jgi:uncharacterized membrane protein